MPAFDTTDDFIWMGIRYLEIYLVSIASPAAKLSGFGLLDFRSGMILIPALLSVILA